jgi:transcriptional regulator with XRE-family HTH domain
LDAVRLGTSFRALRLRANLRQSDLAAQARVPREVISEVERGRISRVGLDDLRQLAAALGTDLDVRVRLRVSSSTAS